MKPRIKYNYENKAWECSIYALIGYGATPIGAYKSWCKIVRMQVK